MAVLEDIKGCVGRSNNHDGLDKRSLVAKTPPPFRSRRVQQHTLAPVSTIFFAFLYCEEWTFKPLNSSSFATDGTYGF